jgi:hypothetical protein
VIASGTAGSGAATKGGLLAPVFVVLAPFVGVFAAAGVTWIDIASAKTPSERRFVVRRMLALWLCVAVFVIALPLVSLWANHAGLSRRSDWLATAPDVAAWFALTVATSTMVVLMLRGRAALRRQGGAEAGAAGVASIPMSLVRRIAPTIGFLIALFWMPAFLAWRTGDRPISGVVAGIVVFLGLVGAWVGRRVQSREDESRIGGWYVAGCALVFLALLNWRLDVWMAPIYAVDLAAMHRLMPMTIIHGLSLFEIVWIVALVRLTRPRS